MFEWWRNRRAGHELGRVSSRIHSSRLDEAVRELDAIDTSRLSPYDVAVWLNNRAYVLALLGSTTEALEHLTDAAELLAGLHETASCTHYDHDLLCACIIGTRGIALVVAGSLDEAEEQLRDAYERGTPHLDSTDAVIAFEQQHLAAERLWWLASIAEKRGDTTRRIVLLRQSSRFANTPYGDKAREALGPHGNKAREALGPHGNKAREALGPHGDKAREALGPH